MATTLQDLVNIVDRLWARIDEMEETLEKLTHPDKKQDEKLMWHAIHDIKVDIKDLNTMHLKQRKAAKEAGADWFLRDAPWDEKEEKA